MSVLTAIQSLLGIGGNEQSSESGLDVLESILAERQAGLDLEAVYEQPSVNTVGETTAVFPVSLYHEGDEYGATSKEFTVPDDGLDDTDAPLTEFVADANNLDGEEVTFTDLRAIEGMTAEAELTEDGEVTVDTPASDLEFEV